MQYAMCTIGLGGVDAHDYSHVAISQLYLDFTTHVC